MNLLFLRSGWSNTATLVALALLPLAVIAEVNGAAIKPLRSQDHACGAASQIARPGYVRACRPAED
jgi:hypothetical protein